MTDEFWQAENGGTLDAVKAEIFDLLASTRWAIRYGTDAAITVLRVDSIIMSRQAGGPAPPKQNPYVPPRFSPTSFLN